MMKFFFNIQAYIIFLIKLSSKTNIMVTLCGLVHFPTMCNRDIDVSRDILSREGSRGIFTKLATWKDD